MGDELAAALADGFVDISEGKDGGCLKKILVEGTGEGTPPSGSKVTVHYVGTLHADGSKFDSSRDRPGFFEFDVGVGQVIQGWDVGICSMKKGEKAILRCSSDYAYGDHGSPPKIPGGATLNFEVELFKYKEKVKEPYEMSIEEKSAFALKQKEMGNAAFAKQEWVDAIDAYAEGVRYVTFNFDGGLSHHGAGHTHGGAPCSGHGGDDDDDDTAEGEPVALSDDDKKLAIALLNNCAAARLKVKDGQAAVEDCTKVLRFDGENVKALYRRAEAHLADANYKGAVEDAQRVLELDKENKAAAQLVQRAGADEKKAKQKEKAMYSKMFG